MAHGGDLNVLIPPVNVHKSDLHDDDTANAAVEKSPGI